MRRVHGESRKVCWPMRMSLPAILGICRTALDHQIGPKRSISKGRPTPLYQVIERRLADQAARGNHGEGHTVAVLTVAAGR